MSSHRNSFNEIYTLLKLYRIYFNQEKALKVLICFLSLDLHENMQLTDDSGTHARFFCGSKWGRRFITFYCQSWKNLVINFFLFFFSYHFFIWENWGEKKFWQVKKVLLLSRLAKFSAPLCTWASPRRVPLSPVARGCCFALPRPFSLCPLWSYRWCSAPPHRERSVARRPNSAPCWSLPTPHRPKDTSVFTLSLFLCVISNKSLCVLLELQLRGHSLYFMPGNA